LTADAFSRSDKRMRLIRRKPDSPLDEFVDVFWIFGSAAQTPAKERALPDACVQLIVNLREDRTSIYDRYDFRVSRTFNGCALVGPQSEFAVIDGGGPMELAGVHFKPGGAYPFLSPPADELHGLQLPLDVLWGAMAAEMRERLLEAQTPHEQFHVMEQVLLARITRSLSRHRAVDFALRQFQTGQTQSIAGVTAQTGLCSRRFIELFRREVGLTPKLFCRVRRFQRVLRCIASGKPVDWTDVALDAGYFDQAHFIHDFRAFSGINPSAYRETRPWHMNHVPLPGDGQISTIAPSHSRSIMGT
jgi:AraC-like DNA-binding protein